MERERRGMIFGSDSPLRRRTGVSAEGGGDEDWVDLFILVPIENIVEALFHVESTSGVVKDSMASMGTVMSTSQIDGDAPLPWPVPKSE